MSSWAYGKLIDALYSDSDTVDVEIPVTYEDGRTSILKASIRVMQSGSPTPQALSA